MSSPHQRLTDDLFPQLVDSPQLLLQKLDVVQGRALLIVMEAAGYHRAAFLDERLIDQATRGFWIDIEALFGRVAERRPDYPPPVFIFHIGHCGSTLLSRLLDELAGYLPVREPPALRTLAQLYREHGLPLSPARTQALLELALYLYSRVFAGDRAALLKATSDCNNLIDAVLRRCSRSRGILLSVGLETYLATMLRSAATRSDADGFARTRLADLQALLGGEERWRLPELDTAQRAALGWMSNVAQLERARRAEPQRTLAVDFDRFLAEPLRSLADIAAALGLDIEPVAIEQLLSGPLMSAYAKAPEHSYDARARARDLDAARASCGREIGEARRWAQRILEETPALEPLKIHLS